jgi:prepilin-type N-terminal cleavage/methylation domain-containing protein
MPIHRVNRAGFTLIEVVLVVLILLLASSLAAPSFRRSFQQAKLQAASREIIAAHRYARSMAVLQQKELAMFVDTQQGQIDVVALSGGQTGRDMFLDGRRNRLSDEAVQTESLLQRLLPEDIVVLDFESPSRQQELDGVFWALYYPSGISDSYAVRLQDRRSSRSISVEVDHLAGTVTATLNP